MSVILLMIFKISFCIFICFLSLFSIAIIQTLNLSKSNLSITSFISDSDYVLKSREVLDRFSKAIQFQTISYERHIYNTSELVKFRDFILRSFPSIHSSPYVTREIVNNYSLLYSIEGRNRNLKPYMLAGHLDVVPVDEDQWEDPPFSGEIKDGFIIGRGTIDAKHIVMGSLEALEYLLGKGFMPERPFYLAFGHDEEVNGLDGARHIGQLLKARNVSLEYILDEGSFVFDNFIPKIECPVAFVGVCEKGYMNLELRLNTPPGHSSFPPKESAIVILSKALAKLEGDIFPSKFGQGPEFELFEQLADCAPFAMKVVFSNLWLFKPFVIMFMTNPIMSALHRTTTAVTIVSGGTKVNVLPSSASALINLRIHPADSLTNVVEFIKNKVNDERIQVSVLDQNAPHPISKIDTFGYLTIKKSIQGVYNDSCVVPTTMIASTDTKWYLDLTESIYRFSLVRMMPKESSRFHGHNEKIKVNNYMEVVNFFLHVIKNSNEKEIISKHIHDDL